MAPRAKGDTLSPERPSRRYVSRVIDSLTCSSFEEFAPHLSIPSLSDLDAQGDPPTERQDDLARRRGRPRFRRAWRSL